jgi:formate dehydrogenase subunit delta
MSPEKLAYMANQIGKFFAHQKQEQAVAAIATHIQQFWDPRMRREMLAHLDDADIGLDPRVHEALARLRAPVAG